MQDALGLNMLLYGNAGVGKTTLITSAQDHSDGANVLLIDVEGGTRSVAHRTDIHVIIPTHFGQFREIFEWLANGEHPYKTIGIDSLTEAQALGLKQIMGSRAGVETPELRDWGKSNEQIQILVRNFRTLSRIKGFNVVFTARTAEILDKATEMILRRPMLTPKAAEAVSATVDAVGYLEMNLKTKEGQPARRLRLQGTPYIDAKVRQAPTGPILPPVVEDPSLPKLLDFLNGRLKE
jgi:hypothetical protein